MTPPTPEEPEVPDEPEEPDVPLPPPPPEPTAIILPLFSFKYRPWSPSEPEEKTAT